MKQAFAVPFAVALMATLFVADSHGQSRIYRCGNSYTNNVSEAQAKGCKLVEGGNVTVVEGVRANPAAPVRVATAAPKSDDGEQRARDNDTRTILEAELKKAVARQAELMREYNNGEPEKLGPETRNHQKYLDRIGELKASIARNESDIAGIQRELGRVPAK